jgi:thiol-disulfide isomerase/thioredoxin
MRALFLMLAVLALSAGDPPITTGPVITGPAIAPGDLSGKVVMVEYWGQHCGACIASIPHLDELAGLAGRDRLVVIAGQGQEPGRTLKVWLEAGGGAGITVTDGITIAGRNQRSIPHVVVYDHTGTVVYDGRPEALTAAQVRGWLAAVPDPLIPATKPPGAATAISAISRRTAAITPVLASLRRTASGAAGTSAAGAQAVLDHVAAWVAAEAAAIRTAAGTDPVAAWERLDRALAVVVRDPLAAPLADLAAEWSADAGRLRERAAHNALVRVMDAGSGARRAPAKLAQIGEACEQIARTWPGTRAATQALAVRTALAR